MTRNMGTEDRLLRAAVATVCGLAAALVGVGSVAGIALLVIAIVMAATAAAGFCPLYRLFGISTCRASRGGRAAAER